MTVRPQSLIATGIIAGLCGAVLLDLYLVVSEPYVVKSVTPLLVMQWDASNVLGMAAYRGGWASAVFGTFLHFFVSSVWGILFVYTAAGNSRLRDHALTSGILLGIIAMAVMRAVIHLGHAIVRPFPSVWLFLYILAGHIVFFGIPVAAIATRSLRRRPT